MNTPQQDHTSSSKESSTRQFGEGEGQLLPFGDQRPEAIAQLQLQAALQQSPQVQQSAQLQAQAQQHTAARPLTLRRPEDRGGLPEALLAGIEGLSGLDMRDVQVHYNSARPARLQAHAYAEGNQIHLAAGQEHHLPHEAWHIVQQRQGRVRPTTQAADGMAINDDAALEQEADVMGRKAQALGRSGQLRTAAPATAKTPMAGLHQLADVKDEERTVKTFLEIANFTLEQLDKYIGTQADWAVGLEENEFDLIFSILCFLKETDSFGTYGRFQVREFYDFQGSLYKTLPELFQILTFGLAQTNTEETAFQEPIKVTNALASLGVFVTIMKNLGTFLQKVGPKISKTIDGNVYAMWSMNNQLNLFYEYLELNPKTNFQTSKDSAVMLKNLQEYVTISKSRTLRSGFIRNFHRFDLGILKQLEKNTEYTSKDKPLTVILYATSDSNGALVKSDSLPDIFKDQTCLTLLVEGRESLSDYLQFAKQVANSYGKDGKISQLLICGHGNTQEISLTGNKLNDISLTKNRKPTIEFFNGLIGLMYHHKELSGLSWVFSQKPNPSKIDQLSRIVFSACDVNAVVMPQTQKELEKADGSLEKFLVQNKNLVQTLVEIVGSGDTSYPKILGANASVRAKKQTLIKDGQLDLVSEEDPYLTASKLEYVEHGTMVGGVLSAGAFCLVNDPENAKKAISKRLLGKPKLLEEIIIHTHFSCLQKQQYDFTYLLNDQQSCTTVYHLLFELETNKKFPFKLKHIQDIFGDRKSSLYFSKFGPLLSDNNYYNSAPLKLVWAQVVGHLTKDITPLLKTLDGTTCQIAEPYLCWEIISPLIADKTLSYTQAICKLAICGVDEGNDDCLKFLRKLIDPEKKTAFSPKFVSDLEVCVKGYTSYSTLQALFNEVKEEENVSTSTEKSKDNRVKSYSANLTPYGSKKNTVFVKKMIAVGQLKDSKVLLCRLPEKEFVCSTAEEKQDKESCILQQDQQVSIVGKTDAYWAILHPKEKKIVFVSQSALKILDKVSPKKVNLKDLKVPESLEKDTSDAPIGDLKDLGVEIDFGDAFGDSETKEEIGTEEVIEIKEVE